MHMHNKQLTSALICTCTQNKSCYVIQTRANTEQNSSKFGAVRVLPSSDKDTVVSISQYVPSTNAMRTAISKRLQQMCRKKECKKRKRLFRD